MHWFRFHLRFMRPKPAWSLGAFVRALSTRPSWLSLIRGNLKNTKHKMQKLRYWALALVGALIPAASFAEGYPRGVRLAPSPSLPDGELPP